jgi:predicted dehydrogenase
MPPIEKGRGVNVKPVVGLVGTGGIAVEHAASWRQLGVPVRVYSPDQNVDAFCAEQQMTKVDTLKHLLALVDVVDICAPTDVHADIIALAAAAGRDVICEKPLARTRQDAEAALAACWRAGVALHPCQVVRYFPEYVAAKQAIENGRIGVPAVLRFLRKGARPTKPWFADWSRSGGILVDQMIHDFDYARWVAGDVATVFAKVVEFPDDLWSAYAILTHRDGVLSHVQGRWGDSSTVFETAFTLSGSAGQLRFASREQGAVRWHLPTTPGGSGALLPEIDELNSPFTTQLGEFIAASCGGPPPRVGPEDGLAALNISLAAAESAATGRAVNL